MGIIIQKNITKKKHLHKNFINCEIHQLEASIDETSLSPFFNFCVLYIRERKPIISPFLST